jgi:Protein of unknown function (DUF1488)
MSLTRLNDGYSADLEGVAFGMKDGDRVVRCLITQAALTGAMGGILTQQDQIYWFLANRGEVEEVASAIYDREPAPTICIESRDLNPDLF